MSWQSYVDDQLVTPGYHGAAIIGHDGNVWAKKNLELKAGEGAALAALFKTPANVFASGIVVNGIKYMGIKGDSNSIYGKKGATGVCLVKTNQTILIGYYDEKLQPGPAAVLIEKLGDYLRDNSY